MTQVLLGIGSNLAPETHIPRAIKALSSTFSDCRFSPIYRCAAVGHSGPPFLNLAATCNSPFNLQTTCDRLRQLESKLGRVRQADKFAPRVIDIDLLTFGDLCLEKGGLRLPREDLLEYAFVLKPVADLVPEQCHPQLGTSYAELWQGFGNDHDLAPANLNLSGTFG